jgi:hypothetical protein
MCGRHECNGLISLVITVVSKPNDASARAASVSSRGAVEPVTSGPARASGSAAGRAAARLGERRSAFRELLVLKVPRLGGMGQIFSADVEDEDVLTRMPPAMVARCPGRKGLVGKRASRRTRPVRLRSRLKAMFGSVRQCSGVSPRPRRRRRAARPTGSVLPRWSGTGRGRSTGGRRLYGCHRGSSASSHPSPAHRRSPGVSRTGTRQDALR